MNKLYHIGYRLLPDAQDGAYKLYIVRIVHNVYNMHVSVIVRARLVHVCIGFGADLLDRIGVS